MESALRAMAVKGETVNVPQAEGKLTSYWPLPHTLYFTLTEMAGGRGLKQKACSYHFWTDVSRRQIPLHQATASPQAYSLKEIAYASKTYPKTSVGILR